MKTEKLTQSDEPLISVILPIYNVETYLPKCMESLFAQTYKNLEFILVDDGSRKECADLCDTYLHIDSRVVVFHKENSGQADARNYGVKYANGEYIAFVDPDDYVDVDYIEYLFFLLRKYQCKMSVCPIRVKRGNGSITDYGHSINDEVITSEKCMEMILYQKNIDTSVCAKLYHRSLFLIAEYPKGKIFEDFATYDFVLQCSQIAIGYESKYTYVFRADSTMNGSFSPRKFDALEMVDKMAKDVAIKYPGLKKAIIRRQVHTRFITLNSLMKTSDYSAQRREIISYIKLHSKTTLLNPKVPKRDKIATVLLLMNYELYKNCWIKYETFRNGN